MPKAGPYELPWIGIDEAVEKLRKIRETCGQVAKREVAAGAMEMSEKGGATQQVFASMDDYGIAQTGGKEVRVTELGELTIYGSPEEVKQAKTEAVSRIRLFREIVDRYGQNPSEDQVRAFLRQEAGIEIARLPVVTEKTAKLLRKMSVYIARNGPAPKPGEGASGSAVKSPIGSTEEDLGLRAKGGFIQFQMGGSYVMHPDNDPQTAKVLIMALLDKKIAESNHSESSGAKVKDKAQ